MKAPNSILWIIVSFAGFLLFVVFFYILIIAGKDITISPPVYFFLIVIIALAATAILAGAMRSVARYNQTSPSKSLYVSGPAVIFFIIIYLGYVYRPTPDADPANLTILFREAGKSKKVVTGGTVNITIGEYNETRQIDNNGKALFTAISANHKGQAIEDMTVDVQGYSAVVDSIYRLNKTGSNTNVTVYLKKDAYFTKIRGRVTRLNKSGNTREGIPQLSIQIETLDSLVTTDSTGGFSAVVPVKPGTEVRFIVLDKNKEIYNSLRFVTDDQFLNIGIK